MGGGGGTSGKVSYPAFMTAVHSEIIKGLTGGTLPNGTVTTGWIYDQAATSPYANKTPHDPTTVLNEMTTNLSTYGDIITTNGPKYDAWAVTGTNLPIPTIVAFTEAIDASYTLYSLANVSETALSLDTGTYTALDTYDTAMAWVAATTDPLTTVEITNLYNTAYNAAMSRSGFTNTAALKGKFRNSGGVATSAFPIAISQIEKAAAQEALAFVATFLREKTAMLEARQKDINSFNLEAKKITLSKQETAVRVSEFKHRVKTDYSDRVLGLSNLNLDTSKTKIELTKAAYDANLQTAKFAANKVAMEHDWQFRSWKAVNDFKVNALSFWQTFQDTSLKLTAMVISAKVDFINQGIEYNEKDKLWHAEKYQYMNQTNAAMSGGGSSAGTQKPSKEKSALTGALAGAGTGAMIGSAVPGVGTAIGAVAGGIIGGAAGYMS